jgi:hypothetical protein
MPVTETLSPKQILAAQHLALGESQGKAAQIAKVTRVTVNRWLKLPIFKAKVEEFRNELEQIEGESFREAAKEVGESIRENVNKILDQNGLKLFASEMVQNEELSPMVRLKAAAQLGKWLGMEAPKPVAKEDGDGFPIPDVVGESGETIDVSSLSDEELQELYLKTLAES